MREQDSTSSLGPPPWGLVSPPQDPQLRETVATLAAAGGEPVASILLYGSHVQASGPDPWSAYDFFLVTDSYLPFYRNLVRKGHHSRSPWVLTLLSHVLAPNIISFKSSPSARLPAKCAVVTPRQLRRSLHPHSPDHFIKGRVVQKLSLVWSRSSEDRGEVISSLTGAREGIVRWVRPFLPDPFDLETFAEKMLRISYGAEIRPESPHRVAQVFQCQRQTLLGIAAEALQAAIRRGDALEEHGLYRWTRPPGPGARLFYTGYFSVSKARATARWFKYMVSFEGWLDYIQHKIERRAGLDVDVSERERRWPLVFLWPKLFLVLRGTKGNATSPSSPEKGRDG